MTLRVSKRNFSPSLGLFRSTINKNIGVIIFLSLAMLIFCPGIVVTDLSKNTFRASDYGTPDYLDVFYGITGVISCILICICNYVNFAYLYKKNSSDVFHSLPLTRTGLLFSRVSAGFIEVLIPITLGYASLSALSFIYPTYAVGTLSQIASAYLVNILYMLAASSFSVIFIICAGSGFDLVLSFFGFDTAVLVVCGTIHALCDKYLSGYSSSYTGLLRVLSPVYLLGEKGVKFANENVYSLTNSKDIILTPIIFVVVCVALSCLLYNYRKAERSEQAYAYKFIYFICSVLAGICGGYALSEIFVLSADTEEFTAIGFISFVIGAIITTVVYGAVTDRGFKKFKRSIILGVIASLVYGIISVIILTGAFGFEKRMPESEKIKSVTVNFDNANITFDDASRAFALHKAILEQKADDKYKDTVDTPHTFVKIIYNLDDSGKDVFMREYFADKAKIKKELFCVYASDERFANFKETLEKAKNDWVEIWGSCYNINGDEEPYHGRMTKDDAKELLSVYQRELKAVGKEFYSTENQYEKNLIFVTLYSDDTKEDNELNIYINDNFPETNKILRSFAEKNADIKQ